MTDIRQRLVEIQSNIAGVKRAYMWAPQSLADSDLPVFCNFAGASTVSQISETIVEETRTWLMRLYVKPVLQGIDGEVEKAVEPFFSNVRDTFLSHPMLGSGAKDSVLPWIEKVTWLGDSGIQVLSYAGQNYLGIEFRLSITKIVPISTASYE
ncbi:hypothetical protein BECAL_01785 [Bellilinea caldifistulae]|uniref:Uncharacterized protein n=1 Tax=Bellilinea caldifistulae TaxID=360411 RepID=A0A0P6Y0G6_9CHLR|nr:hypothetical protein [Bellilinea caldifistulae]KPL74974.1 hypothetical protein AC812_10700 [Bellilinea caldifistulae]GAP10612.1 hypothetical protein BECAL_01785 [Bellilinea caldifistulae]